MNIKKFIAVALCAIICLGLVGCNSSSYLTPTQAAKYVVTLGNYKNVSCDLTTKENAASVKDTLSSTATSTTQVKDRAVAEGDIVNIDYEGKRKDNDVVFSGGTAAGYELEIGSDTFIDGFEDGLVGVKPGETVKLNLKFPKDYKNNTALADKEVVFTVTVNYIVGYSEEDIKRSEDSVAASIILQKVLEGTTFSTSRPTSNINAKAKQLIDEVKAAAATSGMDLASYLKQYYSMTEEQLNTEAMNYANTTINQEIVLMAIANDAGITFTDAEYKEALAKEAAKYGYEGREDDFVKAYGGEDNVRNALFMTKITDYVISVSDIKR